MKANWGVSSRAIPRYETMDEAGYLETIFQSYKNNQIINGGVSPELAGVAALEAMKSGSTAMLGQNEQYNPFNYSITELIDPVTGKVRSDAKLRYSEDWMDEALKAILYVKNMLLRSVVEATKPNICFLWVILMKKVC